MARILIVDDEPDIREMFAAALTLRGHKVTTAGSADDALAIAGKNNFEVAIIDYVLPGMRGLDLLQQLRTKDPFLRSIIISGQIDHDVLDAKSLEQQLQDRVSADRYLPKPASIDSISSAIAEVLKPAADKDWKQMATDAVASRKVKKGSVAAMNKVLTKARKKK